jgi:hypothetical protein
MERSRLVQVGIALLAAFSHPGCGYAPGSRAPPSVETVAVPIFDNQTFPLRRELEYDLTDLLRKEIQAKTSLRLVDQDVADMVVYGTVRHFEERVVSEGRLDEKTESNVIVAADLVVEDYRNRRQWRERVEVREPLSIERGEVLGEARARALRKLAERILITIEWWEEAEEG